MLRHDHAGEDAEAQNCAARAGFPSPGCHSYSQSRRALSNDGRIVKDAAAPVAASYALPTKNKRCYQEKGCYIV